jgi:ABC-2 type transport system ATP-binding protein
VDPVVQIEGLTKVFRRGFFLQRVPALQGLNLDIARGEIFGYLGPNGAGKTTTMKLLMGLIFPTKGKVLIWGQAPWRNEVKAKIGFLPENPYFYDYLKVQELLQFYGRIFGLDRRELKVRIARLLERLGLTKEVNTPLRQLSKGNIQRVGLAQALLNDPDLLILDEPMSGLDPIGRREVRDLILQLHDEGKTILFSTHILSDVETICHRVGILVKGKMRKTGPLGDLLNPRVIGYEVTASGLDRDTMSLLEGIAIRLVGGRKHEAMVELKEDDVDDVMEILRQRGARVISLIPKKEGLEEVFLKEVERADGDSLDDSHSLLS